MKNSWGLLCRTFQRLSERWRRSGRMAGLRSVSLRPSGERIAIEVKGRAGLGTVELTETSTSRPSSYRTATGSTLFLSVPNPNRRLCRVQNPFKKLVVNEKKRFVINEGAIFAAAEEDALYG